MSMVRPVSRRVDRLEELMAELAYNMSELSREQRESEVRARRADEALAQHLAEISNELRANINNLSIEMRVSEEKNRQANEALRRTLREADERSRQADEALRQRIEKLSLEMREADERSREADERARKADEELREHIAEVSRDLRDNMDKLSKEMRKNRRDLNKKIAEMSDKMGTLAEDLIAPSVPKILAKVVNCTEKPQMKGVRVTKALPDGRSQEYDVIAVCGNYVLICEAKSRLRPEQVRKFCNKLSEARDFLPEYAEKQIIGALGTFYIDPSLIKHCERQGLIMLGVIDGLMQILNEEGFAPKEY